MTPRCPPPPSKRGRKKGSGVFFADSGSVNTLVAKFETGPSTVEVTETARQFTLLVTALNQLLASPDWEKRVPQLVGVVDKAESGAEKLIDHTFRQGVLLILVWLVAYLVGRLAFQGLSRRFFVVRSGQTDTYSQ